MIIMLQSLVAVSGCKTSKAAAPDGSPTGDASCLFAAGNWTTSIVSSAGTLGAAEGSIGATTSLAVSPDLQAAIAYDETDANGALRLATMPPGATWTTQIFPDYGQGRDDGEGAVVHFDSAGNPIIAVPRREGYPSSVDVRLADGTPTSIAIPVSGESVGAMDMALDRSNGVHVAYSVLVTKGYAPPGDAALKYATWDGTEWSTESVESGIVFEATIAVDSNGRPSIAFVEKPNLMYARRGDDGTWAVETIDDSAVSKSPSLATDSAGVPHVAYVDDSAGTMKYAIRGDNGWLVESVGCAKPINRVALALDAADLPHVAFTARQSGGTSPFGPIQYALRDERQWTIEQIGASGENDTSPSLVLSDDGTVRVAWSEMSSGTAYYSERH